METTDIEFCKEKASVLEEHYKALVNATKNYLYPQEFNTLSWLPDCSNWSELQKTIFCFFFPHIIFTPSFNPEKDEKLIKVISFAMLLWGYYYVFLIAGMVSAQKILNLQTVTQQNTAAEEYFALFIIVLFSLQGVLSLIQTSWFLVFNKKTNALYRVLSIGFMLYLLAQFRAVLNTVQVPINLMDNGIHVLFMFWVALPFILVASFVCVFLLESLFAFIFYFVKAYSGELSNFSHSLVFGDAKKPIKAPLLVSLPIDEIQAIKSLAQNSLEVTEKKTTPSTVLLSILAIGIAFTPFVQWIEPRIKIVLDFYVNAWAAITKAGDVVDWLSNLFVLFLITIVVMLFLNIIIEYVRSLSIFFTQGFIIEACTIAEYAKTELGKETIQPDRPASIWQTLMDYLFGKQNRP